MLKPVRLGFLALAGLCLVPFQSAAQSAPPIADTFSNSGKATTNYGANPMMMVQPGYTSYVQFNLSTLPAGAVVEKATLRLFLDSVTGKGQIDVYEAKNAWNEALLNYNNEPLLGASATGGHPTSLNTSTLNQFVLIDITPLVEGWVNGTIPNYGVAIALVGSTGSFSFDTKESTLTSHHPELEIVLQGPTGPQGAAGPQGIQGIQGPAGSTGATGPAGATGATGPQGPAGAKGATGATGATGPQGTQGVAGAAGATGPQGPIGPQGLPGAAGTNGTNGTSFDFRGAFDPSASYAVNDVATFNGSSYVAVHANQGPNNATPDTAPTQWILMAAMGAAGPAGSPGPAGATGAQGATGLTGATGSIGPAGPAGPTGTMGVQGPVGPIGPAGSPGATGAAGPAGPAGTDANANARMVFPSFFPGNLSGTWTGGQVTIDQPITILRIAATAKTPTGAGCPSAVFRFTDGSKGQDLVLAPGAYWSDSGPIVMTFAAGATLQSVLRTGSTCAANTGADANLLVEYKMQAADDTDTCPGTLCAGICETTTSDPSNCGGCANACATGQPCVSSSCGSANGSACTSGSSCQSGVCSSGICAANSCAGEPAGTTCGSGFCISGNCTTFQCDGTGVCQQATSPCSGTVCGYACVNTNSDVNNCGTCGNVCNTNHDTPACVSGACAPVCNPGFANCNGSAADGCEVNTQTDSNNCGSCGNACQSGQTCAAGACVSTLLANGSACTSANACTSGNCDQGTCCAVSCALQAQSTCGSTGACTTNGTACARYPSGTVCASGSTCDGAGNCVCNSNCAAGTACTSNSMCLSGACDLITGKCATSTCTDQTRDGNETDIDCGGTNACARCANGNKCQVDTDCGSNACDAQGLTCVSNQCADHRLDGTETAIDCGGGSCSACSLGQTCNQNSDCSSNACNFLVTPRVCVSSQCADGQKDGAESDIDCGGSSCSACATGKTCNSSLDCQAGHVCTTSHVCQ